MARNVSASRLRPDRKAKGECCASGICYGRRQLIRTVLAGRALVVVRMPSAVGADENPAGTLYKAPQRLPRIPAAAWPLSAGETEARAVANQSPARRAAELKSCDNKLIDGYVVAGHVPVETIRAALREIALPGMPQSSPGMTGAKTAPFTIYEISSATPRVYAVE